MIPAPQPVMCSVLNAVFGRPALPCGLDFCADNGSFVLAAVAGAVVTRQCKCALGDIRAANCGNNGLARMARPCMYGLKKAIWSNATKKLLRSAVPALSRAVPALKGADVKCFSASQKMLCAGR